MEVYILPRARPIQQNTSTALSTRLYDINPKSSTRLAMQTIASKQSILFKDLTDLSRHSLLYYTIQQKLTPTNNTKYHRQR